jgi:hypothetical protein
LGYNLCVQTHAFLPRLTGIRLHPIKSLDPVSVTEARIGPGGGLEHDRAWALFSVDGRWVNGKRTAAMHLIRASYAPDLSSVTLAVPGDRRNIPARSFPFPGGAEDAAEWFSVYFEQQILVRHAPEGFPDDTIANGPTIISTASLQAVCDWFPGVTLDNARQRFRTTLEIDSADAVANAASANGHLPAFWEDQLRGQQSVRPLPCPRARRAKWRRPRRLPKAFQRSAPRNSAALGPRRPLRPFLSPSHKHPRRPHRNRRAPPPQRSGATGVIMPTPTPRC